MGRLLSEAALADQLDELPSAGTEVLAGEPVARARPLHQLGGTEIGLWELSAGQVTDVEVDEVFVVLAGRGRLTLGDGTIVELRPGVVVGLDAGEHTVWSVTETVRKLYIAPADS
jgi:uncharacterized cupin superfamily protein